MSTNTRFKTILFCVAFIWGVHISSGIQSRIMANPSRTGSTEHRLRLRTRVEAFKGSGQWNVVEFVENFLPEETAILICDMWDKHWCSGATRRVNILAQRMDLLIQRARSKRVRIIHAPSDTMGFYADYPQRKCILEVPAANPPESLKLSDPPLPIDDSDGGCDTPGDTPYQAWTRQHPSLSIGLEDVISDDGHQIYSYLRQQKIRTLLVMGVHTNMCVLNRSFAIRQMTRWGVRCALIRDLTDTMYDPQDPPHVSHEQGTELVIEHIEKYWCPTLLSEDLLFALKP